MDPLDFDPATTTMARLVTGVADDQLTARTPCPDYSVADLVDHIGGLAFAFTESARKGDVPGRGGSGDGSRLEDGWRERIAAQLAELAEAWRDPAAYDGITMAGPIEMPAEVAALVALDEVVVHGWDLARSTGQRFEADDAAAAACLGFAESFETPADDDDGPFGPPVPVPADDDVLDRLIGATGRDPSWTP
ncbi:MAG: TIGR03086 family metal-binding protein [Nocardioides sp.]